MHKPLRLLALLVTTTALACEPAVGPEEVPQFARSANAPVHQVSAGGQVDYSAIFGDAVDTETYGFTASIDGNGNVRGQFESHWGDFRFHMDITCLSVVGNEAWLGGVTTRSNHELLTVGTEWVWHVVDNGQGKNAAPDQLSFFSTFTGAENCGTHPDLGLFDWTEGNVQVK